MIISRTPFRASFLGGGSDLPWYYERYGGAVISSAITQYMYIMLHPYFGPTQFRLKYSRLEDVDQVEAIRHPIIRACLKGVSVDAGLEIASIADIPAGTGLGSSSSFTVGLLNALHAYNGQAVPKWELAKQACQIEIEEIGSPIGKQDQFAAACGGVNVFRFQQDGKVSVEPLNIDAKTVSDLEANLRLYYLGGTRSANDVLQQQDFSGISDRKALLIRRMVGSVDVLKRELEAGNADVVGPILNEAWQLKREIAASVTTDTIDEVYDSAIRHGATGGKLLGAGGNGFMLLWHRDHDALQSNLRLKSIPFGVDFDGTTVYPIH